jgi:hypothetical protein
MIVQGSMGKHSSKNLQCRLTLQAAKSVFLQRRAQGIRDAARPPNGVQLLQFQPHLRIDPADLPCLMDLIIRSWPAYEHR